MTKLERRKGGGSKLSRSETVTVRLDPKLRYLAELAARQQRRTLSSYIEWAIEDSLRRVALREDAKGRISVADEIGRLWDVDEPDRFARLALLYPALLTHEEQVRWKVICECGHLWKGEFAEPDREWTWKTSLESLKLDRLREAWDVICKVASGRAEASELPSWPRTSYEALKQEIEQWSAEG